MRRTTTALLVLAGILLAGSPCVRASQPVPSEHVIVPGVRVGDYTLGITKDEVLKKLGKPQTIQLAESEVIHRGEEKYRLNNLPSKCVLCFGDVSFGIAGDSVGVISVHGPLYRLSNGLGVGDSEQNIRQALGEGFQRREEMGKNYLCYDAKGLAFAIHETNQAATEIVVYHPEGPRVLKTLPRYDPDSSKPFQVDLRGRDLSKLDLRESLEDLLYADFDDGTIWPGPERTPAGFRWRKIMELGKNPGLGVRRLHAQGITGRGVRIAIIDQPLLVDHQEYAGRVRLYEEMDLQGRADPTMHGAAVASIALGQSVGVAPEAELYYIAMQFFGGIPLQRLARSVHRIIEVNAQLPKDNKIRVISISKGWLPSHEGYKEIMEAVQKAQAAGMLIVGTDGAYREGFDFGVLGRSPLADPDVFESYEPGLFTAKRFWSRPPSRADRSSSSGDSFSVPMDSRTTAGPAGIHEYVFYRIGGASWAVPYVAGAYALAVQADPAMTPERFWTLAARTGRTTQVNHDDMTKPLGPIIDPVELIRAIQTGETATRPPQQSDNRTVQAPPQTNSETQTIVPGVRVGDYTLGMSRDEVLKRLGEPQRIELGGNQVVRRGEEKYSLKNLPRECVLGFGDLSFRFQDESVQTIFVCSSLYKLSSGLGVGDLEQDIKQAFGNDYRVEQATGMHYLGYDAQGLGFEIDEKNHVATEIIVYPKREDPAVLKTIPKYDPDSDNPFQIDLRGRNVSKLDLRASLDDLRYASFDDRTVWPAPERMPAGFDWRKIMELGKNPGLGVRRLHAQGITGRGVRIAIIDQPLLVGHQEYTERLRFYEEIDVPSPSRPQMHGAAVASIALGETVGVAPEAELYYIARAGGSPLQRLARCIHRIVEVNAQLPKDNKIRVISMSTGWAPAREGYGDITEAVRRAQAAGILVLCTSVEQTDERFDFDALGRSPLADPDAFGSFEPGLFRAKDFWSHPSSPSGICFSVPMDSRTTASQAGVDEYVFYRIGGFSWAVPYIAGVYALAVQADPAITPERFWALAVRTGRTIELHRDGVTRSLGPIIDPVRLIRAIQTGETVTEDRPQSDGRHVQTPRQTSSESHTIIPGVGVGDHALGMGKDEVVSRLGKPESIFSAGETYTLDNVPRRYFMSYGDLSFAIDDDVVTGITVLSPSYRFAGGLGVGDSVKEVKEAFGDAFRLAGSGSKEILTYEDRGLSFEIGKSSGTVLEINVFPAEPDGADRPRAYHRAVPEAYENIGGRDLRAADLRNAGDVLDTLGFNQQTLWPPAERLPQGFDPNALLEEGMNPGLGVRALHAQGITGSGVHVGLIDQPLLPDHPEYEGKIVSYHALDCGPHATSMHGPAMTSQLVGQRCGTAPGASLHVVAVPSWKTDAGHYARALDRLVAYNEGAPKDRRIRVVSVSAQPSGEGSVYQNQSSWDEAVQRAQDKGILVLDCTWHHGFVSLCWLDPHDRERVQACTPGFRNGAVEVDQGHIHVPSAPRTAATAGEDRRFGYSYDGGGRRSRNVRSKGGYSDTIPYAAGILALGWQIRPDLSPEQMKESLFASAHVHESGAKIIHPAAFIELVRTQGGNR